MSAPEKASGIGRQAVGHPIDVASGVLFHEVEDYVVPGRMPLAWGRRYSSGLLGQVPVGIFGPCWSSPYQMRLHRDLDGYAMLAADGETTITFDDPAGSLAAGGTLHNLGAFHELRRQGSLFVVTKWNPEEHQVEHFRFEPTAVADSYRLRSQESSDGQAIDILYDGQGRIARLRQRREGRSLALVYDQHGRVSELRMAGRAAASSEAGSASELPGRLLFTYRYDAAGRLCEAVDALEQRCAYDYDAEGRLIREVLLGGMVYHFRYDAEGRCIESVGLDGFARTTLAIDKPAHVTQVTNSLDNVTTYSWNDQGQVQTEVSPLGHKRVTEFDSLGRVAHRITPSGAATVLAYDEHGDLCAITEPTGAVTRFEHNDRHELVAVVDPAGFRWARGFDAHGRLDWVENPLGERTTYAYSGQGDPVERSSPLGHRVGYDWDAAGNLRLVRNALGHATRYEYDDEGLLVALVEPGPGQDEPGPRTALRRDALGRVIEVRLPDGALRRFAYHPTDQVTQYVDENGAVSRWRYLLCGFLSEEIKPLGMRVQYQWGSEPGILQAVTNEAVERYTFSYDAAGRIESETDFGGRRTAYQYDGDGNITSTLNAGGQPTAFLRNKAGALTEVAYHDGTQVKLAYDPRGLLLRAENPDALVERQYDALGRLLCERTTQGDSSREVRCEYDADGRRIRRTSSLGYEAIFDWNPNDQLAALRPGGQEAILFDYAPDGSEQARYLGNGTRIEQRHDARGRVIEQSAGQRNPVTGRVAVGGPASVHRKYRYDPAGNLLEVQDARWGQTRYEYDQNGRITSRSDAGRFAETFVYDPADNLRRVGEVRTDPKSSLPQEVQRDFAYRPGNQLERVNGTTYKYDALGQLVEKIEEKAVTRYEWNAQGMLAQAILPGGDVWHYTYDAFARRLAKQGPKDRTEFLWDGDVILHEIRCTIETAPDVVNWEFEPGGFVPIGKVERGQGYLCVNDINGAPRELLDQAGRMVWAANLSTNGLIQAELPGSSIINCPIRFQGQWQDIETTSCYNRFRYFDPYSARYVSMDPLGLAGGTNQFVYTSNSNLWIDPYGLIRILTNGNVEVNAYPGPDAGGKEHLPLHVHVKEGKQKTRVLMEDYYKKGKLVAKKGDKYPGDNDMSKGMRKIIDKHLSDLAEKAKKIFSKGKC